MRFEAPWAFLLILIIPLLLWGRRKTPSAIQFPSLLHAAQAGRSLRQRFGRVPLWLRGLALILLIVALARPQKWDEWAEEFAEGIAIQLVVDRSSSMRAELMFRGERLTRLEVVQQICKEFILGNGDQLAGRPHDVIGIIAFARNADTIAPLTPARQALPGLLESIRFPTEFNEDGTAIGDAIALAAARLKLFAAGANQTGAPSDPASPLEEANGPSTNAPPRGIIILLTDGENNAGKWDPLEAAKLAAGWGITVYTLGVGTREEVLGIHRHFPAFRGSSPPPDEHHVLARIADMTGGIFGMAEDGAVLESFYQEIDRLETSLVQRVHHREYQELFGRFALAALLLLAMEAALKSTLLRRLP